MVQVYRVIGNKKPSYLSSYCDYIAVSVDAGSVIKFFPVRGHPSAQKM
jgi:hypothetical protein